MSGHFLTLVAVLTLALPCYCVLNLKSPLERVRRSSDSSKSLNENWNATKVDKLKRQLLLNYDKFSRPSPSGNATVVSYDPEVIHVELDETRGVLAIHAWIKMTWTDEKLKWDSRDAGLTEIRLADHEIWQPDIVPYNSATGTNIDRYGNTHAIVRSDGSVIWVPPAVLEVFCDINLTKWPFDTQECILKVGSWTYDGMQIDLTFNPEEPSLSNLLDTAEWKLMSIKRERKVTKYACCSEPYVDLTFTLTIKRHSPTYKALIVSPITVIVLMTLATFWLPSNSGDKISLGATTLLIICIFLLYFSQKVAVMAGHTPLLVLFYVHSLYMVGFSLVISVIVINLASTRRNIALPWIIKSQLTGWTGRLLLLPTSQNSFGSRSISKTNGEDENADNRPMFTSEAQEAPEGQENVAESRVILNDWYLLTVAIDRIAFLLYCLLFICFAAAYSV